MIGNPHYEADHKTCVVKVKLEANKTYGWWLNSPNFHNIKDAQGHPAVPYLLVFKTGKEKPLRDDLAVVVEVRAAFPAPPRRRWSGRSRSRWK